MFCIIVAQLESYLALSTGKLETLSPQQLVSCAPNPMHCGGTGGCAGSVCPMAFTYTQMMGVVRYNVKIPLTNLEKEIQLHNK